MQDLINPLWRKVADGCYLNRPTDQLLAGSGFQMAREERFKIGLSFYEAEFVKAKESLA
jgi:hypothetical protein